MTKAIKRQNWLDGTDALENLVAFDYEVKPFSDIHFRINGRLDVWPSTRSWYDLRREEKGNMER